MTMTGWVLLGTAAALVLVTLALPTPRRVWAFSRYALAALGRWIFSRRSRPEILRHFCEDMGPTYIKFGQIVASSSGMFPRRYVEEFQKCLDRVRPFPFAEVKAILAADLREAGAARLSHIDTAPLASASIAQVHAAKLDDGTDVVVKVQRPGIQGRIRSDMRLMRLLAWLAEKLVRNAELASPAAIVEDFAATLEEELDFRKEADNLDAFNRIMAELGHADVRAPRPLRELTTARVLVMERFFGARVDDVERIAASGADAEDLLIKGLRAWFQCVLFYGFFHGDVHAGNLMLLDNRDIGFLDFGIVGRFDARQKAMVTDYIVAFAGGDYRKLAQVITAMGGVSAKVDQEAFARDLEATYRPLLELSFQDINYAEILPQIHRVATRHRMRMPKEFVLITKQMLYFDRYAKLIAPRLNLFTDPRLVMSLLADVAKARAG